MIAETKLNPCPRSELICELCGHQGNDVHEYPTYDRVLHQDTYQHQCDDINACYDRMIKQGTLPSYYRTTAELAGA